VLSRRFRNRFLDKLAEAHRANKLQFFGEHQALAEAKRFADWLKPLRQCEWVVYAKRPFAGPEAVLAYLARYTHRVAIANSRLIALDERGVTFRCKDYRCKGRVRYKAMTLAVAEFIRRFLLHVLPAGLHRIRHYGLLANTTRKDNLARARELLMCSTSQEAVDAQTDDADAAHETEPGASLTWLCPDCGAPMIIIETFECTQLPRAPPGRMDAA
jgi:hypothetical protein